MGAVVDTQGMLVRTTDAAFRFEADCGAGAAVFDPDGAGIKVRLMTWGEKCSLARFAQCGSAFVEHQFVGICASGVVDPTRHEAVAALVFWLHAPEVTPLPFDASLLARASLDLCRALATEPAAIAERPAPEIEALWRALSSAGGTRVSDPVDDDVTRIIVLPDDARADEGHAAVHVPAIADPAAQEPPGRRESAAQTSGSAMPGTSAIARADRARPVPRFVVRFGTQELPAASAALPKHAAVAVSGAAPEAPRARMKALYLDTPTGVPRSALPSSPTGYPEHPPSTLTALDDAVQPVEAVPARVAPQVAPQASTIAPLFAPEAGIVRALDDSSLTPAALSDAIRPVDALVALAMSRPTPSASSVRPAFGLDPGIARVVAAVSRSAARAEAADPGPLSDLLINVIAERLEDAAADAGIALAE